jgi:MFS family permease
VQSSKLNGLIFIGGIAGFIIFGWITSHTRYQHKRILIITSLCLLIISLLLYSQPQNIDLVGLLLFAMGLFSATIPTATDFLKSLMPVSISGLTISVLNFTLVIVGAISQPLFGYLLQRKNPASTSLNAFGANDFHQAFLLMPIIFAISFICALLIKQVHSQASH